MNTPLYTISTKAILQALEELPNRKITDIITDKLAS